MFLEDKIKFSKYISNLGNYIAILNQINENNLSDSLYSGHICYLLNRYCKSSILMNDPSEKNIFNSLMTLRKKFIFILRMFLTSHKLEKFSRNLNKVYDKYNEIVKGSYGVVYAVRLEPKWILFNKKYNIDKYFVLECKIKHSIPPKNIITRINYPKGIKSFGCYKIFKEIMLNCSILRPRIRS